MYQLTLQEVTNQDYEPQYSFAASSKIEEIDNMNVWDSFLSVLNKKPLDNLSFYHLLLQIFKIEWSSVGLSIETVNEVNFMQESVKERTSVILPEKDAAIDMLDDNFIVHMRPVKEWKTLVKVKKVEKAKPHILEFEEFIYD